SWATSVRGASASTLSVVSRRGISSASSRLAPGPTSARPTSTSSSAWPSATPRRTPTARSRTTSSSRTSIRTSPDSGVRAKSSEVESAAWTYGAKGVGTSAGVVFRPKAGSAGSRVGAFNVRGANLVGYDYVERELEGQRLDGGGHSKVTVRVASVLAYTVLKILAFQDRHENKDSYDLVFCLLHYGDGPDAAGTEAANSAVARDPEVTDALALLAERFQDVDQDGPTAYATFLAEPGDDDEAARLRREAVATVRAFLDTFHAALGEG